MKGLRGVHYARVSDTSQVFGASLDQQTAHGIEWCARKGVELVRCFREEGESGRTAKRSKLNEALEFLRAERRAGRSIDLFVIHDLSRFFRNLEEQWALKKRLLELGVRLDSVMFPITEDAHGRFMQNSLGSSHQFLVELNAEKIRDSMMARTRQGRWPHPAPMGYLNRKTEDGSRKWVEVDPERAPLLRRAFDEIARGAGITATLQDLTERGFRTKRGFRLRVQEFRALLVNPFYAGKVRSVKYGFEVEGEHEGIVPIATFERVRARLTGQGAQMQKVVVRDDFPLRGFVRCEACDRPLTSEWSRGKMGKRYAYYRCWLPACRAVKISAGKLEQAIVDDLERIRLSPGQAALLAEELRNLLGAEVVEQKRSRASANARLVELKKRRDRVIDGFLHEGVLTRADYDEQMRRLNGEITSVHFELSAEHSETDDVERTIERAKALFTWAPELWSMGSGAEKRELQTLVYPKGLILGKTALRTPEVASLFNNLEGEMMLGDNLVARTGFEPVLPA